MSLASQVIHLSVRKWKNPSKAIALLHETIRGECRLSGEWQTAGASKSDTQTLRIWFYVSWMQLNSSTDANLADAEYWHPSGFHTQTLQIHENPSKQVVQSP